MTGTGNRPVPADHIEGKTMNGNTINNFIDDLLTMGGPEKEFVFREKLYFLETVFDQERSMKKLYLDEYDNSDPQNQKLLKTHSFWGNTFAECVEQFEAAKIFDGMTIYEAEQEIEVLYG